jgi:glutamate transport system permease protein
VTLLKDTSLGTVVNYDELLRRARDTGTFYGNALQVLTEAAVIYIIVNFTLSRIARRLEIRQRRKYKAGAITVTGVEDLAVVGAHAEAAIA